MEIIIVFRLCCAMMTTDTHIHLFGSFLLTDILDVVNLNNSTTVTFWWRSVIVNTGNERILLASNKFRLLLNNTEDSLVHVNLMLLFVLMAAEEWVLPIWPCQANTTQSMTILTMIISICWDMMPGWTFKSIVLLVISSKLALKAMSGSESCPWKSTQSHYL